MTAFRSLLFLICTILLSLTSSAPAADTKRPNILFIFADDQAYNTIAELGNDEIETPNLDRLVRQGTTFTHAYNQGGWHGAVCVASRCMLNTGRFLWHAQNIDRQTEQERAAGRFWSEYLKGAGYKTYFSGKWHVEADARKAFDVVGNVRPGMPNQTHIGYHRPVPGQGAPWKPWDKKLGGYWKGGKHWSEVLADNAVAHLEETADDETPLFMYIAFNAPHDPFHDPPAELAPVGGYSTIGAGESTDSHNYRKMLEALDTEIGRL
ncbi:MAG: sulfatase-like hydrolase/transferase, partial [Planctomycetales bacterium]